MAGLFEIDAGLIELLDEVQLTRLLERLLRLEAYSAGIAQRAIDVGLSIKVPDGGEDGRIEWRGKPANTDYLPGRLVQFQIKATTMRPKACADELVDKKERLKPMIKQALNKKGTYTEP